MISDQYIHRDGGDLQPDRRCGFSLIEVCLAILVVGFGLLSVFALFPSGLRSAEDGTADTRCGLFTDSVMAGMRANSFAITSWDEWDSDAFAGAIREKALPNGGDVKFTGSLEFPAGSGDYVWYRCTVDSTNHSAFLEVCDGAEELSAMQIVAYTEFWYPGM